MDNSNSEGFSQIYNSYREEIDKFNSSMGKMISDLYSRINTLNEVVAQVQKSRDQDLIKAVSENQQRILLLNDGINKLSINLNTTISNFNSAVDKINQDHTSTEKKVNQLNNAVIGLTEEMKHLSDNLNGSVTNFNKIAESINLKSHNDSETIKRIEETARLLSDNYKVLSDGIKDSVSSLTSMNNEMSEKLNKLSETVYAGLPGVNSLNDEIIDLKKAKVELERKFEKTTNATNSLAVETNGLNLKMENMAKEFQNIQKAISDTQNHVMDFINIARSSMESISNYNPEEIKSAVKMIQDKTDSISKEVERLNDNEGNFNKQFNNLASKIADLSTVKNATKVFENAEAAYKNVQDSENRINAQASKVEIMFNEILTSMNRFVNINKSISDLAKKTGELENDINKLKAGLQVFATKDEIVDLHNKLNELEKK
ncbi:MAG: hypothetical protein M1573_00295 [Candidatus Parvarchaeota archaeon]|nr:hypothetical protein [Candidatus Parvarchaeota archaeon]